MFVSIGSRPGRGRRLTGGLAGTSSGRELLTAARTYYVRADGDDLTNNGLSDHSGGAFKTLQRALDAVGALDTGVYDVTIHVGPGTYAGCDLRTLVGAGACYIEGDRTTPSNCLVSATADNCFDATNIIGRYQIHGFKCTTATTGSGIFASGPAVAVTYGAMDFGAVASGYMHIWAAAGARIVRDDVLTLSGGAACHMLIEATATFLGGGNTITLTGTPAFSSSFVLCRNTGVIDMSGVTFTGSATGVRYVASRNGLIDAGGAGASYFPGNSAGSTATGGQYV